MAAAVVSGREPKCREMESMVGAGIGYYTNEGDDG